MAKAPAEEIDVDGVAVRLSSPDKVHHPALGARGTERAVVEHYRLVARQSSRRMPITSDCLFSGLRWPR